MRKEAVSANSFVVRVTAPGGLGLRVLGPPGFHALHRAGRGRTGKPAPAGGLGAETSERAGKSPRAWRGFPALWRA
jgi:hypothetical protein